MVLLAFHASFPQEMTAYRLFKLALRVPDRYIAQHERIRFSDRD